MSKNAITNYFRKSLQIPPKKRPFPADGSEESRERVRRKSPLNGPADIRSTSTLSDAPLSSQVSNRRTTEEEVVSSSQSLPLSQHTLPTRIVSNNYGWNGRVESQLSTPTPSPTSENLKEHGLEASASTAGANSKGHNDEALLHTKEEIATRPHETVGSQPPLTSSQRIVRNGETMIRNSDDESDDSLEDLDDLLASYRSSTTVSIQPEALAPFSDSEGPRKTRRKLRRSARAEETHSQQSTAQPDPPKKFKFSLEALNRQRKRDEAAQEAIARAEAMLESYDQRNASAGVKKGVLSANLVETAMKDHRDDDNTSRLKSAIQRTEALEHAKSWSFFENNTDSPLLEHTDFPEMEDERLQRLFGKTIPRQQFFLSGYVGEYAMKQGLPEEVLLWITDAICTESRDDLRYSYTSTLKDATGHLTPLLTPAYIGMLFRNLGATARALDFERPVIPHVTLSESINAIKQPNLLSILTLLGSVAGDLASESQIHLLNALCRLAIDRSLIQDCHLVNAIQEAFANIIESLPEDDLEYESQSVLTTVYNTISDATLRLQLLQTIPSWSSRLILLKQRLALASFFQDPHYLSKPRKNLVNLTQISKHLQTPQFTITKATDFTDLAATISTLSIGIDCGNRPPSPIAKDEEKNFNKDVDVLAAKINSMFNAIVDTGASHMKKTESKEVLEGFQRRLEYAVRTKPKPRKLIYGDDEVPSLREKMEEYLEKGKTVAPSDII